MNDNVFVQSFKTRKLINVTVKTFRVNRIELNNDTIFCRLQLMSSINTNLFNVTFEHCLPEKNSEHTLFLKVF